MKRHSGAWPHRPLRIAAPNITISYMTPLMLSTIIFLAIFTQAVTGFGGGLVSVALLGGLMDMRTAVPMMSLVGLASEIVVLARYRHAFSLSAVTRLAAASLVGVPIGVA